MSVVNAVKPGLGEGVSSAPEEALLAQLLAKFTSPRYRPPTLPTVALELLQLAERTDTDVKRLVGLLEKDPMLAAQVLKLAQSAAYAGRMPLTSLRDAVVRLGMGRLRDLVMEASLSIQVFRGDGVSENMERLRLHSTITGHLARVVCRTTPLSPEYAFLCGLLHDIGVAGSLIVLDPGARRDLRSAWPAIGRVHARASAIICKLWKLPPEIEKVVGVHSEWNAEGTTEAMSAVVCIAEELAWDLGYGFVPAEAGELVAADDALALVDRIEPGVLQQAFAHLELDPPRQEKLRVDAIRALADLGFGVSPSTADKA
jgi:HD-like signal output (HDOD) protein